MKNIYHGMLHILFLSVALSINMDSGAQSKSLYPAIKMAEVKEGSLLEKSDQQGYYNIIPNLHTNVKINIQGMVSSTTVDQVFTNDSTDPIEAVYVFPLPSKAAVNHMTMIINDRVIKGDIKEKKEAKRVYEEAKKEGKRASLTELERPNVFTNSVSNILPGDTVIVRIKYVNEISYNKGVFGLRFPMVVAPRYISGNSISTYSGSGWAFDTDVVPDASRITPHVTPPSQRSKNSISLEVEIDSKLDIERVYSPSHSLLVSRSESDVYRVILDEDKAIPNKDFVVEYRVREGKEPKAALFMNEKDGENYFMLMAIPPDQEHLEANDISKEMIFVVDVSGSMTGTSIEQAKSSLVYAIEKLDPNDSFNIIPFHSNYSSLSYRPMPASDKNKAMAKNFINLLVAQGGTEAIPPLQHAMQMDGDESKVKMIVFITDGSVGYDQNVINLVKNQLGRARLFSVGIGSAPNSHLLEKVSRQGRGTFTYISSISQVSSKVENLFKKIETPVLTNIKLELDGQSELFPNPIPDLFMDEPLVVFGKVGSTDKLSATFSGKNGRGYFKVDLPIDLSTSQKHPAISTIWARKKIDGYMDEWYLGKKSAKQDVIDLAIEHDLVSRFTSFVAVEHQVVKPPGFVATVPVPVSLPEGWNYDAIFGSSSNLVKKASVQRTSKVLALPQTSTNMPGYALLGLVVMALSAIVLLIQRRPGERDC